MKDLRISYDNDYGKRITMDFDTIMDFIEMMESDNIDIPMLDYENVEAVFWENPLQHKHFDTIDDLYKHCIEIVR